MARGQRPEQTLLWKSAESANIVQVQDQGPGIPADELAQVTRRFVRGRQAKGAGSGLGLAIVELATERLGGRLALGPAEGGGLLAELEIPCEAPEIGASSAEPARSGD